MNKMMVAVAALMVATTLRAGYVLDFSGVDSENKRDTRVITDAKITTKTWTLECWARRTKDGVFRLFAQYPGKNYSLFFGSEDSNSNGIDVFMRGGSGWWKSGSKLDLNVWRHLAMTKDDSGTVKVYVDGVLVNSHTDAKDADHIPSDNQFLWLGNTYSDGTGTLGTYYNAFPGYLAEMRLWNVVRTQEQLAANKGVRLSGAEEGLVGYWPLNEAVGTNVCNKMTSVASPVLGTGGWFLDSSFPLFNGLTVSSGFVDFASPTEIGGDGVILGPATLRYTGSQPATLAVPIFVRPGHNAKAGILFNDIDLTLVGNVVVDGANGSFLKRGAGTLTVRGENCNWSKTVDGCNSATRFPATGDSPSDGVGGFSICDGTVIADGGKHFAERMYVGRNTTADAGAETAGHLIIRGNAEFSCESTVAVGAGNGTTTTAPTPLSSSLTIEGGTVLMKNLLTIGSNPMNAAGYNAHPVFNMNGGSLEIKHAGNGWIVIGESDGSWGTANLNGGEITASRIYRGAGHATLHLNGTVIRMKKANGSDGYANLVASGFGGFDVLDVGAGGAIFDCVDPFRLKQAIVPMSGVAQDGGLTKRGEATLASTNGVVHTFTGPVRIEAGTYVGTLGKSNDLFVAEGAVYDPNGAKTTVGAFDCRGTVAAGTIEVTGAVSSDSAFTVTGTLMMAKTAAVDFGCTSESPAPLGTSITLGTVGTLAGKRSLGVVNTGRAGESEFRAYLTVENGTVKAVLGEKRGLCLIFR